VPVGSPRPLRVPCVPHLRFAQDPLVEEFVPNARFASPLAGVSVEYLAVLRFAHHSYYQGEARLFERSSLLTWPLRQKTARVERIPPPSSVFSLQWVGFAEFAFWVEYENETLSVSNEDSFPNVTNPVAAAGLARFEARFS